MAGLREKDVRGLDVAMDDPTAVRVGESLCDLCAHLERAPVVELSAANRLPQRAARNVLVGDVDVRRVAGERNDPLAAAVPQGGGRTGFALGAMPRFSLAGADLQRDVEAALVVAGPPHVPHPAGAERPNRPVPAQEEVVGLCRRGHARELRPEWGKPFSDRSSG